MAEQELSTGEVIERIKATFTPNHCKVKVEYRARLWHEVFDRNQKGRSEKFTIDEIGNYRTRAALNEKLQQWRQLLGNDGYEFG